MISVDEDALICDLMETYHIYDYESLPVYQVAIFSCGLREDSRIKKKMAGIRADMDDILLAGIFDRLNWLVWSKTENGKKNINHPKSILELLTGEVQSGDIETFTSSDEYEEQRSRLLKGGESGGE